MSNYFYKLAADAIASVNDLDYNTIMDMLETPPQSDMGDIAFPCFKLAKLFKKSPLAIASEIKDNLKISSCCKVFDKVEILGGYLNFYLNKAIALSQIGAYIDKKGEDYGKNPIYKGREALIEHTSINPNASPHIGRARNALIGDAIVRLHKFLGYDTKVHYLVNDIGKQISLLVYATKDKSNITFKELLGLYVEANERLLENPEIEKEVFNLLYAMEHGDKNVLREFKKIVDICVRGQSEIFNKMGIFYDCYDYESEYIVSGKINNVLDKLKKTDRLFEDEEKRLVLNLEEFNINSENPFLPLTRGDKTSLYPLRDICYSIDKASYKCDKNIVVLGEDQKLYGRQINAALSLLGYTGAEIVNYSFVLLPDGKMSTRKGQVVLLEDLMEETIAYAAERIKEKGGEENYNLAKIMAYGAIKYSILKCGNDKNVIFDQDKSLSFNGDTSVYLQYSYARVQSLVEGENIINVDYSALTHPAEWEIIKHLATYESVLEGMHTSYNFSTLTTYLFNLAQKFSKWYSECPIKKADEKIKVARLWLSLKIAQNIKSGLYILGIETADKI